MPFATSRYVAALEELIDRGLRDEHAAMLKTHWAAPRRTVSMAQLARAAGYPAFNYASIQYGSLAKRVARYGGIPIPRDSIALYAVATWSGNASDARGHFAFTMRPELATAMEQLGLTQGATPPEESNDAIQALEGAEYEAVALHRRREQWLRRAKIEAVLRDKGHLRCQVPGCGFDFEHVYGAVGAGYAQVHHLKPLSSRAAAERTRLEDLVVVCANCHAMVHRFGALRALSRLISRRGVV